MTTGAAGPARAMTLEEWAALDEEVEGELVDGILEEEERPTFLHEIVVAWLIRPLHTWARRRRGLVASSETKIAVGPRRGRKPDVSVYLPGRVPPLADALVRVPPHLAVEVASPRPRDVRRDRVEKLGDYARAGASLHRRRSGASRRNASGRPHVHALLTRLDARHEDRANAHPFEHPLREGPEVAVVVQYPAAQDGDELAVVATDEARSVPGGPLHGELNVVVERKRLRNSSMFVRPCWRRGVHHQSTAITRT